MRKFPVIAPLLTVLASTQASPGLAEDRIGPDKDQPHPTTEQAGWPRGMVKILQHDSRVYSVWVNGNENFYFKASPGEIGELITLFSQTRLRDHVVVIKKGPQEVKPFDVPKGIPYNVQFAYLDGIALFVTRKDGEAKTYDPTLTIYVDSADEVALLKPIPIPDNITMQSEVPIWLPTSTATVPMRRLWHAEVRFESGKPAADFENGVSTKVTWWETDEEDPIGLGAVDHKGFFNAAFSEEEIGNLKSGRAWLTLTVGNQFTRPGRDDPKLEVGSLVLEQAETKPVQVALPGYYHGRVLFEDGTPAIFDPEPWPGGQLSINFSFAGAATLDPDGYFQVYFTPEQFEEVRSGKVRKNVYVPSFEDKGRSTALHAFPPAELSLERAKAGEIRIPKPGPGKKAP